jgi:Family of unknown function (DUF5670)
VRKRTDVVCRRALGSATVAKEIVMLSALIVVLLALWLLGLVMSYTLGGLIHVLAVIAIAVAVFRVVQGRNPIRG